MARIAVIGAGMGALAAAARLAVAGHTVTVYERGGTYGGSLGRYERDGFAFDTGPGLLLLPAVYRDLFVKTGKRPLESCVEMVQVDPAVRHVLADGRELTLPAVSRGGVAAALDEAFGPGAGERWADLLGRARDVWDATRRPLLEEPLRSDWQVLGRDPYPALRRSGLLRRRPPALAEVAARELAGPLGALLTSRALEYGIDPGGAPAAAAVVPYMEQTFGSWYVRGGLRALAAAVHERCLERRVEFVFDAEVTAVRERDGRAAGLVLADGTEVEADHVVCGIDPRRLAALLPGRELWPAGAKQPVAGAPSRFTVLLALRGGRPADTVHRTVVHSADPVAEAAALGAEHAAPPTVTVLRPDDELTRPDGGHEAVTLTATVAPHGVLDWTDPGLVARYTERMLKAAGRAVPELCDRILWHEARTPLDVARATGTPDGAVPAPSLAGDPDRLHAANTTALPGLYLAGGWSHPGGGLPHAGMSGALVAGLIVEGRAFRGSQ
ncbi:NAD(P)/FAD-dependent oxidoreductase [Streptomyces sp. NPDC089919]|uniref:phytoene desaturase family protein n=1 Tax=Streptomyces sp. NPDC089919 TaxID=3155188 RepID=UPI0034421BCA